MSKLSKRAISLFVIATMILSILSAFIAVPVMAAAIDITSPDDGGGTVSAGSYQFGGTVKVIGTGVTAGALVNLYWDYVTAACQMNSTLGEPAGTFEVWVDVPEATAGNHYIWVKDVGSNLVDSVWITVDPLVKLSPSSGLEGDDVDVKGYGFGEEVEVGIQIDTWTITGEALGTGVGTVFYLDYFPVVAGSVTTSSAIGFTLEAATGKITFASAPAAGVTADYTRDVVTIESSATFKTTELGSFTRTFDVPDFPYYDTYQITAHDVVNTATADFKIGASISVTPEEGPTGTKVTVDGRGWTTLATMTFMLGAKTAVVVGDPIIVNGGTFSADIIIPGVASEGTKTLTATESGVAIPLPAATVEFEVTGLPEIVVTPTYGSPGAPITVKGCNFTQIAGTEIVIELQKKDATFVADLVIAETESDGTFEDTFISPAVAFVGYDVYAEDTVYDIDALDAFKVGLIALIINPVYGEAGTKLSITGIGFLSESSYNVTFGAILYENYGKGVTYGEAISDIFYVPNVPTGIYDMTISDEDGNEMTVEFRVTAVTGVTLDPAMAPNKYNVTIEGCNFADKELEYVDFVLYNATDEWDMDVEYGGSPVKTGKDGNFTGYWGVLEEDTLSLGDYTVNITGYDDFFVQVPFSVVEARVEVAPRKALFDRGDSIQFNVKNDFKFIDSYMKIWDPYENLYWQTGEFEEWVKAGDVYTVPYYLQTSGMNPMELSQDAPLGTWVWAFYTVEDDQLVNGTFEVGPSAESLLTEKIEALSEELGIDIDTLRVYIDDLGIDMNDAVSSMAAEIATAVSGMEDEISGLSDDLDDAVTGMQDDIDDMGTKMDSIETMVDDISETSGDAQQAANDAKTAAEQATEAAEANQQQTSGLTGLVYGAIGASLIAALAAIVSLMQISRRIAG